MNGKMSLGTNLTVLLDLIFRIISLQIGERLFQKSQVYYNIFGQEAGQPVRLSSILCLSYNKRSNWLTYVYLGFYAR